MRASLLASAIASKLRCARRLEALSIHGHRPRIAAAGRRIEDDVGGLHKQGAQVLVAALGDFAELGAIAGRLLLGHEAEPGAEVATLLEAAAVTDRRHHGAGDDRADTRHASSGAGRPVVVGEALDLG